MSTLLYRKQKNKEEKQKEKHKTVPHATIDWEMLHIE